MARPRRRAALALAVLLSGIEFWLGEAGGPTWGELPIAIGIAGSVVVALAVAGRPVIRAAAGAGMIAVYALTFLGGQASFGRAFNECVERGEEVRILLAEYYRNQRVYPETLNQLRSPLPCRRISRPTILIYERTTNGYELGFRDWLVDHTASEDASFFTHK
ncbi:hypothetical protein ACWAT4_31120 [Bradyrhizobium manausense]